MLECSYLGSAAVRLKVADKLTATVVLAGKTVLINTSFVNAETMGLGHRHGNLGIEVTGQYGLSSEYSTKVRSRVAIKPGNSLVIHVINSVDYIQIDASSPTEAASLFESVLNLIRELDVQETE